MKLKTVFTVIFILSSYLINSQTITPFSHFKNAVEPIQFTTVKIDLTAITSLTMLSKIGASSTWDEDYTTLILDKNYDWAKDAFRNDSYKRMVLNFNKHDRYGRDLLRNLNEDLVNQVYFKNSRFGY